MKYQIMKIEDSDAKEKITLEIMNALPKWFSPPEDIIKKSRQHRDFPFFAAFDGKNAIGFIALKIHNEFTADIYNLGVLEAYHRAGIGSALLAAAECYLRSEGFKFLTVKTLDSSAEYEPYERTRSFYRKSGFYPLEVFPLFWNIENPCLFMCKCL